MELWNGRPPVLGSGPFRTACVSHPSLAPVSTMDPKLKQQKRQDNTLALLDAIIEISNLAKEFSSPTPAKAVFGSVSILLKTIRVCSSSSPMRLSPVHM